MTSCPLLPVLLPVLLPTCCLVLAVFVSGGSGGSTAAPRPSSSNSSRVNSTLSGAPLSSFTVDSSMIQRSLYVLIGVSMVGVLYFLVRAVRLKKPIQRKKYGLLLNESVEMEEVETDEDDTLFEARSLRR
ncbi:protein FAM174C [Paralichthys olivaceus]|uniref:protein FAM174C n=1 Tax=Paralichthys olivaceus TaxID=8255 RepID=UPI00374FFDF7